MEGGEAGELGPLRGGIGSPCMMFLCLCLCAAQHKDRKIHAKVLSDAVVLKGLISRQSLFYRVLY